LSESADRAVEMTNQHKHTTSHQWNRIVLD
jgi:hypothetical protein